MTLPSTPITTAVNPTSTLVYYCDPGDIQRKLSIEGVTLRTKDYGNNSASGEIGSIEDAIWDATEIINFYCFTHYEPGSLAKSLWINRRATEIACYILCKRKGNIPSGSISADYKQAIDWLEKVHAGLYELPNVPYRHTLAPAFSNVRIDQRYPTFRIRVEQVLSDRSPAPYPQYPDWASAFDYSW